LGFRNLTVHACFAVDWQIVWTTAVDDAPAIRAGVARLLEDLPDES